MSLVSYYYVDLGLSCLWGTMNHRAETSAEPGEPYSFKFANLYAKSENERNIRWTTSEMTLSAFVALHGDCKPKQYTTLQGELRHSIDATDGSSAIFCIELENLLSEFKSKGEKLQLDQSILKIRGYENLHTRREGFLAYYNSKSDVFTSPHDGAIGLPTIQEWRELFDKCKWEWGSLLALNGYKVTGPNGKSIFLPAAGVRIGEKVSLFNEFGGYWAYGNAYIGFQKGIKSICNGDNNLRFVRLVYRDLTPVVSDSNFQLSQTRRNAPHNNLTDNSERKQKRSEYKIITIEDGNDSRFGKIVVVKANLVKSIGSSKVFSPYDNSDTVTFSFPASNESLFRSLLSIADSGDLWTPDVDNDFSRALIYDNRLRKDVVFYRHKSFFDV